MLYWKQRYFYKCTSTLPNLTKFHRCYRYSMVRKSAKFQNDTDISDGDMTSSIFDVTSNNVWRHNSIMSDDMDPKLFKFVSFQDL